MIPNVKPAKDTVVKPAKLLRARAPKPLLPLGLKRGKKGKNEETESDKGDKTTIEEPHKEQVINDYLEPLICSPYCELFLL